jgi:hypothetical protein
VAPYAFEYPVQLEDVVLQGRSVNVDSLTRFNTEVVGQRVQTGVVNQIYRPWQQGLPQVPVFFRDAQLSSDEVIFQNIIMDNFRSRFSIYPNGYLDLSDTRFVSAGGDVQGRIALNPTDNNFVTLDLVFQHVQANAIAQAMLNASNRIFGELSGVISYTTSGDTQEELFDNANGYAQILIENGRLPEIAKIETLLTAANLLRGGVLGLNLNNLFRTLIPFNTNYFARLSGSMQIAQGVMHTQNLTSDGQNLDLLIQGRIRLIDGYGNLAVTGNMSQNVSGRLGVLGKLSVGKVLRWVPLLGAMPSFTDDDDEEQDTTGRRRWRGGLLNYLPGVGYVPGLGGVAQDYSRFQVTVEGPLEDPGSVREMKWLAR